MATKKQWSDLTDGQRAAIVIAAGVELVLTTLALVDLARRPAAQVRGPKALWALGSVVQPVGPIAYLLFGRPSSRTERRRQPRVDAGSTPRGRPALRSLGQGGPRAPAPLGEGPQVGADAERCPGHQAGAGQHRVGRGGDDARTGQLRHGPSPGAGPRAPAPGRNPPAAR